MPGANPVDVLIEVVDGRSFPPSGRPDYRATITSGFFHTFPASRRDRRRFTGMFLRRSFRVWRSKITLYVGLRPPSDGKAIPTPHPASAEAPTPPHACLRFPTLFMADKRFLMPQGQKGQHAFHPINTGICWGFRGFSGYISATPKALCPTARGYAVPGVTPGPYRKIATTATRLCRGNERQAGSW